MINEVIAVMVLAEVKSNWKKFPIRENIYNRMDGWFKTRRFSTGYNRVTNSDGPFQSGGTATMSVYEVSCRAIAVGQEFRNLGRWSWILV